MMRQVHDRYQPERLIGLSEADARRQVEAAGGIFEAHFPDEPVTLDLCLNRVRVEIVDGQVTTAWIG